jgi:hypothetical protein
MTRTIPRLVSVIGAVLTLVAFERPASAACACTNLGFCDFHGTCDICDTPGGCNCPGLDPCTGACGDAYNNNLSCNDHWLCYGSCPTGQKCETVGSCCTPMTRQQACGTNACGTLPDGCGGTVNCGGCLVGVCRTDGTCCIPSATCSGRVCGTVPDGCGGTPSCGTCPVGLQCNSTQTACIACVPKTCAQLGAQGACGQNLSDGCGGLLDCETSCPSGMVCGDQTGHGATNRCTTPVPAVPPPALPAAAALLVGLGVVLVRKRLKGEKRS